MLTIHLNKNINTYTTKTFYKTTTHLKYTLNPNIYLQNIYYLYHTYLLLTSYNLLYLTVNHAGICTRTFTYICMLNAYVHSLYFNHSILIKPQLFEKLSTYQHYVTIFCIPHLKTQTRHLKIQTKFAQNRLLDEPCSLGAECGQTVNFHLLENKNKLITILLVTYNHMPISTYVCASISNNQRSHCRLIRNLSVEFCQLFIILLNLQIHRCCCVFLYNNCYS